MKGKTPLKTKIELTSAETGLADTRIPVEVTEVRRLRRASGAFRDGVISITLPLWWNRKDKLEAVQSLTARLLRKKGQDEAILNRADLGPRITITTVAELAVYVREINAQTFNVPVKKIRMGNSRYSQLAQMNMKTKTMTVSRYCMQDVPESALRYLIVHELAHLLEGSHNKRFWSLVGQHVPDYKKQSRFIRAFHHLAVEQGIQSAMENDDVDEAPEAALPPAPVETKPVTVVQQLMLALSGK